MTKYTNTRYTYHSPNALTNTNCCDTASVCSSTAGDTATEVKKTAVDGTRGGVLKLNRKYTKSLGQQESADIGR